MASQSSHTTITITLVTIPLCFLVCAPDSLGQDNTWKKRFQEEAPVKWAEYVKLVSNGTQGSQTYSHFDLTNARKLTSRGNAHFKLKSPNALVSFQAKVPKDAEGELYGLNASYAFKLTRKDSTSNWTLATAINNRLGGVRAYGEEIDQSVIQDICLQYVVWNRWIPKWTVDPEFTIKGVSPVILDNVEHVRVEFDYRPQIVRNNPVRSGWMLLDPSRFWAIRECEAILQWGDGTSDTLKTSCEFKTAKSGLPVITRYLRQQSHPKCPPYLEHDLSFELFEANLPEYEFTLSAFGIPEPSGISPPSRWPSWAFWLFSSGVVCVMFLVGIRKWRRNGA